MSSLTRFNPFRELELFARRFDDFFASKGDVGAFTGWKPSVDIKELPEHFEVTAELPGVKKEDCDVSMHDGILSISGERKQETEHKDAKAHRIERSYGSFERSFTLPPSADEDKVDATFTDGVLKLKIAKRPAPEKKGRKIEVT